MTISAFSAEQLSRQIRCATGFTLLAKAPPKPKPAIRDPELPAERDQDRVVLPPVRLITSEQRKHILVQHLLSVGRLLTVEDLRHALDWDHATIRRARGLAVQDGEITDIQKRGQNEWLAATVCGVRLERVQRQVVS